MVATKTTYGEVVHLKIILSPIFEDNYFVSFKANAGVVSCLCSNFEEIFRSVALRAILFHALESPELNLHL